MKTTIAKKTEGYGYKYTELADINKYCEDNNIRYWQEVETSEINQKDYIITYLYDGQETKKVRGCQIVDSILNGIKNPVQEYGSSLTYCRRYSLLMALGLATEDDDAASLTKEPTKEEALEYTFNFGKYAGKKLNEVPTNYLAWLIDNKNDARLNTLIKLATGFEILSEEKQKEKIKLIKEIEDLVFEKSLDLEDIKESYNVDSLANLTFEDTKKLYGELRGEQDGRV